MSDIQPEKEPNDRAVVEGIRAVRHEEGFVSAGSASHAKRPSDSFDDALERIRDLRMRIKHLDTDCDELRLQINYFERMRAAIEDHGRGWPLTAVLLLGIVAIGLEYFSATQITQLFDASGEQPLIFRAVFAIVPVPLALSIGELLRRRRVPARPHSVDVMMLVVVTMVTAAFLVLGFWLRLAYLSAFPAAAIGFSPWLNALALTSISAIGITLIAGGANYREGITMFRVSRKLVRLRAELAQLESYRKANQRDLDRAEGSANPAVKRTRDYSVEFIAKGARLVSHGNVNSDKPPTGTGPVIKEPTRGL